MMSEPKQVIGSLTVTFEQALDPELLATLPAVPPSDNTHVDLAIARQRVLDLFAALQPPRSGQVVIEDRSLSGVEGTSEIRVRIYRPRGQTIALPAVLWIHGGGFIFGSPVMDDGLCQRFVEDAECVVVSVDWHLAPEYPFPAGLEDCYTVLCWMKASASDLLIDREHLAVAGDSAGGGLAAALALLARDRGGPRLIFQMPLYAALDDRHITPSSTAITDGRVWNTATSKTRWQLYLAGSDGSHISPYAAPARAEDLSALPPAYLCVGEMDLVRDENIQYAMRLMQADVSTELHVYPGAFHGFEILAPGAQVSQHALAEYVAALRRGIHRELPEQQRSTVAHKEAGVTLSDSKGEE